MGYILVTSPCGNCHRLFSYNPNLVPSIRVNSGDRVPICGDCIERANVKRRAAGIEPLRVLPGAYEPADESSIDWGDD